MLYIQSEGACAIFQCEIGKNVSICGERVQTFTKQSVTITEVKQEHTGLNKLKKSDGPKNLKAQCYNLKISFFYRPDSILAIYKRNFLNEHEYLAFLGLLFCFTG